MDSLKGAFSGFLFFKVGAIIGIASLFTIYWQSQYYHQEQPFPHRTISQVAEHYPEFLSFRLGTITGAGLLVLGWMTNHFMLQTVAAEHGVDLSKYHPQVPLVAGLMGGLLLMLNTATIDTGHMNETLHEWCAASFFVISFFAQVYNTVIVVDLQKRTQAFSKGNLYLKYGILAALGVQLVESLSGGQGLSGWADPGSNKSNFLEWTLTATIISMFLSMGLDCGRFELVYTEGQRD